MQLIFSTFFLLVPPGLEPGLLPWKGGELDQLFYGTIKLSVSQIQLPSNCHWYITKVKLGYSHLLILFRSCPNKTQRANNGVYGSRTRFSTLTTWREKPFLQYSIKWLFFSKRKVIVFLTSRFVSYLITKWRTRTFSCTLSSAGVCLMQVIPIVRHRALYTIW